MQIESDVFKQVKNNPKYTPNNSVTWFRTNVTNAFKNMGQLQFMGTMQKQQTTVIYPGRMYFFGYDPKYKAELPYYDKFPLILPFNQDAKHIWGINLHYLPLDKRILILDKLVVFAQNKKNPEQMKLKLSWDLLNSISEHKAVQFSVKCYLKGHVKTRFIEIPMMDWPVASFLPMARFEKANEAKVWKDFRSL